MKGFQKERLCFRRLARSWKSGFESQGSEIDIFTKPMNKEIVASRALAEFRKSESGVHGPDNHGLGKGIKCKSGSGSHDYESYVFTEGMDEEIVASRAPAKSWKSGSGGQGADIHVFSKLIRKESAGSRALAKFYRYTSGGRGHEIHVLNKMMNKKIATSMALAKSWNSGAGSQGSEIDVFSDGINKEIVASRALVPQRFSYCL